MRRLATLTAATFAVLSAVPSMAAVADPVLPGGSGGGQVVVVPGDNGGKYAPPSVDSSVHAPGAGRTAGSGLPVSSSAGGNGPVCSYRRAMAWERWVRSIPADSAAPGVPASQVGNGTDSIDPNSHLYARTCNGVLDYVWIGSGGAQGAAAPPSPAVLARDAFSRLVLPLPSARHSPDLRLAGGEPAVLVGEHTWVWVDRAGFSPRRKRVQAGAVWALVTATPLTLRVEPGDGSAAVVCHGAGTPFDATRYGPHAASPTCDHVYARSSFGLPEERVIATYEISWRVTWVGSTGTAPASGSLPDLVSRATTSFAAAEAQALITGG